MTAEEMYDAQDGRCADCGEYLDNFDWNDLVVVEVEQRLVCPVCDRQRYYSDEPPYGNR